MRGLVYGLARLVLSPVRDDQSPLVSVVFTFSFGFATEAIGWEIIGSVRKPLGTYFAF